jgi:hypothetical protein
MHAGKYIRFDSTQELQTRATCAERHDHRIIARAQALIVQCRERSQAALFLIARIAQAYAMQARGEARIPTSILAMPILSGRLRGLRQLERAQALVLGELDLDASEGAMSKALGHNERIKSKRRERTSQSNFSSSPSSHFCRWDVATPACLLETRCESSDSPK